MMMAFFALIALLNALISWGGGLVGLQGLSIEYVIGQAVRPLVWLMGVPWADTTYVGTLMGVKVVLTELVAYTRFASDMTGGLADIQPRSMIIATYALLGFANLPSIAIQIGGISSLAPSRRSELSKLGLRAMIAGQPRSIHERVPRRHARLGRCRYWLSSAPRLVSSRAGPRCVPESASCWARA